MQCFQPPCSAAVAGALSGSDQPARQVAGRGRGMRPHGLRRCARAAVSAQGANPRLPGLFEADGTIGPVMKEGAAQPRREGGRSARSRWPPARP